MLLAKARYKIDIQRHALTATIRGSYPNRITVPQGKAAPVSDSRLIHPLT